MRQYLRFLWSTGWVHNPLAVAIMVYTESHGGGGQLLPIAAIGNLLGPNVNGNQGQPLH